MAASKGILRSALLRVAVQSGNPTGYLNELIAGRFTRVNAGNGRVTIGVAQPGSSATFTIPAGFTDLEIIELAEICLRVVESGINSSFAANGGAWPVVSPIQPLNPADQGVTYGIFTNIAR